MRDEVGVAAEEIPAQRSARPELAVSGGAWTQAGSLALRLLESLGRAAVLYPADGVGGRKLEGAVRTGLHAGVLDLVVSELADEALGGLRRAGPDRLTAAALAGIPQVICPGGLDGFLLAEGQPPALPTNRPSVLLPDRTVLWRTSPDENDRLGREVALKASAARGPTAVLVPLGGVSDLDLPGRPFHRPASDAALFESLRLWLSPHVRLVELDFPVSSPEFAAAAVRTLLDLLDNPPRKV